MLFETQVLKGYFTRFTYKLSAQNPYQINYSFSFTVTETLSFLVGSNIANTVKDIIGARFGNISKPRNDVSLVPEDLQFGKGWGVQLF